MQWPLTTTFANQHSKLVEACHSHQLPTSVILENVRQEAWDQARKDAEEIMAASAIEFASLVPALEVMLP